MTDGHDERRARERKAPVRRALVAVIGLLLALDVGVARAIPGPDPNNGQTFFTLETDVGEGVKDVTRFEKSAGWDFGDRSAYRCAWVEFFQAGTKLFEVEYHAVSDYPGDTIRINDRYGTEAPDGSIDNQCWDGDNSGSFVHDGSDHFPHSTSLVFYTDRDGDGQITPTPFEETGRVDYSNQCTKFYWTPGDHAAEAWLWWDQDGPADKLMHGDGLCGGGPKEPVAIERARVRNLAPGVMACVTDAMDGDLCRTSTISAHPTRVTLRLRGDIRASGFVRILDGTAACRADRIVVIQRRVASGWKAVRRDRTSETGRYATHIKGKNGAYRARVPKATLPDGDECNAAISKKRTFRELTRSGAVSHPECRRLGSIPTQAASW